MLTPDSVNKVPEPATETPPLVLLAELMMDSMVTVPVVTLIPLDWTIVPPVSVIALASSNVTLEAFCVPETVTVPAQPAFALVGETPAEKKRLSVLLVVMVRKFPPLLPEAMVFQ